MLGSFSLWAPYIKIRVYTSSLSSFFQIALRILKFIINPDKNIKPDIIERFVIHRQ